MTILEIKEQTPVVLTEKQRMHIKRLCKNAYSAFCYKTIFANGKTHYTDVVILDENDKIIKNILSSDLGLVPTI